MEINSATSTAYDPAIERPAARAKSDDDEDDDVDADAAESSKDKVDISPEAARLAAKEAEDAKEADDADEDSDGADSDSDKSSDVDEADDGKPSTAKAFAYGALGLERPEEAKARETDGYDFGRWLAAGITVGSIISILV